MLGLGPGARRQSVALDIDRPWSSDYLIEYIEVMRSMWGWRPVKYHGKHFKVDGSPAVRPHGDTIPVYIGAFSEEARTAAAVAGDGWMANWIFTPEVFSDIMSEIRDGARRAGRDPSGIAGFYLTGVAMTGGRDQMIDFARRMAFGVMPKIQLQDYGAKLLEMAGYKIVVEEPSQMPDEFVERMFLIGDRDEVIGRIEEYEKAGVEEILLYFADEGSERSFVDGVMPYFRGIVV